MTRIACSWCGENDADGKHQSSYCCVTCKRMGAAYRVSVALERWKRLTDKAAIYVKPER